MDFVYSPIDEKELKKQKALARNLRKTRWWRELLQAGRCFYCGDRFAAEDLTMDHKVPLSRGGKSSKNNIVASCKECNNNKKYFTPAELILKNSEL